MKTKLGIYDDKLGEKIKHHLSIILTTLIYVLSAKDMKKNVISNLNTSGLIENLERL
ncbi:3358_t:CDS:2, partial [Entrophospora sp. SA101]